MSRSNGSRSPKILPLEKLKAVLAERRKQGKRIAMCHGVFDLLHPGHVVHLQQARSHGDLLVVTVTPDRFVNKGPGRPLFNEQLRLATLAALADVDFVALNEWPDAARTIRLLRPDAYIKGSDYADAEKDLTGKIREEAEAVRSVGGRLVLTDGFTSSSSRLINQFYSAYPPSTQEFLDRLRKRRSAGEIIGRLRALSDLRVLVVGEAILDEYCYAAPLGKSPKETIVATRYLSLERFAGGAVATANHVGGFCRQVTLLTALGPDREEEDFLRSKLRGNVRLELVRTPGRPTVRKRRYLEPQYLRKMFEIQHLDDAPLSGAVERRLGERLAALAGRHDLVVVNDFGHGMLSQRLRERLSARRGFLALNTQSNSANLGFNPVTHYRRADYVAIDLAELHLAARTKYGDDAETARRLRARLRAKTFLVSLGADGSLVHGRDGSFRAPALATKVVDRVGAGDALFAVTSPCAYRDFPADLLAFVGNCVGALAVEIVCNREPVDPVRLYKFIETLLK